MALRKKIAYSPLCDKLFYIRRESGMTQQQVADALNINRTTYTKYETGVSEPSLELLIRIAELFQVKVDDLLTRPRKKPVPKSSTEVSDEQEAPEDPESQSNE